MAEIKTSYGTGGSGLTPNKSSGDPSLAEIFRDAADDLAEIRTQFVTLLAKLDADAGVTDADYAALLTPLALLTTKGP